jgi:hypothetical protein
MTPCSLVDWYQRLDEHNASTPYPSTRLHDCISQKIKMSKVLIYLQTNLNLCFVRCTFRKANSFAFINALVPTNFDCGSWEESLEEAAIVSTTLPLCVNMLMRKQGEFYKKILSFRSWSPSEHTMTRRKLQSLPRTSNHSWKKFHYRSDVNLKVVKIEYLVSRKSLLIERHLKSYRLQYSTSSWTLEKSEILPTRGVYTFLMTVGKTSPNKINRMVSVMVTQYFVWGRHSIKNII